MRSPKQVFFDHLKQLRELNRRTTPTDQDVEQRAQELVSGIVRDMGQIVANEQGMHQMKMLLEQGIQEMITERFIFNGGVDTLQIVDGRLRVNVNIVPLRAAEWITINFSVGPAPRAEMEQRWHNFQEML